MTVHLQCEHPRGRRAAARLRRRAAALLAAVGREEAELSILLVGDRGIRRLNREWRGHDVATDVLSFPQDERAGPLLGDVVISLDTAARVAKAEKRPVADELDRYLVHGLLHLLGMDHDSEREARAMAAREDELLAGHGLVSGAVARSGPLDYAPPPASLRSGRTARDRQRLRSQSGSGSRPKR